MSDNHGAVSPRSVSGSTTTSTAYTTNMPSRVISPLSQKTMSSLQNGPPDLRVSVPHPHESPNHWQAGQQHHMATPQQYQVGGHSARGSWDLSRDMSDYLESPATAGGSSTSQPLNYGNSRNIADAAGQRSDNQLSQGVAAQQQSHQISRS